MTDTPTAYGFSMTIPSTFDWYCPHCGKRKDGGPDDYVVEHMHGMKPLVYGLCRDCAMKHHRWMEGEE